jgi:transposase, IS30 family
VRIAVFTRAVGEPKVVAARARFGDWEADLIEGTKGSGYILSLYESKSYFGKIIKLTTKTCPETIKAIIKTLKKYIVHTITYDNGLEFSKHEEISKRLRSKGYFCKPYSSWDKGAVENYNGLVRQYFLKGNSFKDLKQKRLDEISHEINKRPRSGLEYQIPADSTEQLAA